MSERTFILNLSKEEQSLVDDTDIISIITIRMMEVYLEISDKSEVSVEFLSYVKAFIDKNLVKNSNFNYSINVDFEKDLIV